MYVWKTHKKFGEETNNFNLQVNGNDSSGYAVVRIIFRKT